MQSNKDSSLIDFYGEQNMLYTANPQITFFANYKMSKTVNKKSMDKEVHEIPVYRHTHFDKSCVEINGNKLNNKFNLTKILYGYDILTGMTLTCNKDLFNSKNIKIIMKIDEVCLSMSVDQMLIYDKLYNKIIYESEKDITTSVNLPFGFFRNTFKSLVLHENLDVTLDFIFDDCMGNHNENCNYNDEIYNFYINLYPVELNISERERICYNNNFSLSSKLIDVFEEYTMSIPDNNTITLKCDIGCAIREIYWFYTYYENNIKQKLAESIQLIFTDVNNEKTKIKYLTKNQCTQSNQIFHHNNVCDDIYYYCFALNPKSFDVSGESGEFVISNGMNVNINSNINRDENKNVNVTIINVNTKRICFYKDPHSEKIKCTWYKIESEKMRTLI